MKTKAFLTIAFLFALVFQYVFAQEQEVAQKKSFAYSNITEGGFFTTSPNGAAFEVTTIHGFSVNKKHNWGFGFGIGVSSNFYNSNYYSSSSHVYCPMFVNYRHYFSPEQTFSPHLNVSLGGVEVNKGSGVYSAITMGFRIRKFSLSSGMSFMAVKKEEDYSPYYPPPIFTTTKWYYPYGITIKCGVAF